MKAPMVSLGSNYTGVSLFSLDDLDSIRPASLPGMFPRCSETSLAGWRVSSVDTHAYVLTGSANWQMLKMPVHY